VVARLLEAGRAPSTPVAVIERGTTPAQRSIDGTLADIVERVRAARVTPPALTIVGEVVRLRRQLAWFEARPLLGKRLLAVSSIGDHDEEAPAGPAAVEEALAATGIEVVWAHPLRIVSHPERVREPLARASAFSWLALTSHRAAAALATALDDAWLDARALAGARIACVGDRTAQALRERAGLRADLIADGGGATLANAMLARGAAGTVLFLRAADGREELPSVLSAAGLTVEVVAAYQAVVDEAEAARVAAEAEARPFDAIAFASPRGAAALLDQGLAAGDALVGAIGHTTERFLVERGLRVEVVASRPSFSTLLEELAARLARPPAMQ
jgi:uroporphyrinogen III methyltransferase/synthase